MALCRKDVHLDWRISSLFLIIVLLLSACRGDRGESTPTATLQPSSTPEPTLTPITYIPLLTLNPNIADVVAGTKISIVLSFDPPIRIQEAKWKMIAGSGLIEPSEGSETVVFTAPQEAGSAILDVSGTTSDGTPFDKKYTFNVVLLPTPTPLPLCPFTSDPIAPPKFTQSTLEGTIVSPARCENNLPVGAAFPVSGTASNIPENAYLWLLALARNGLYYPQCNNATIGLCSANYDTIAHTWSVPVYLGDKAYPSCKERYYLVLAAVDSSGNDALIEEMKLEAKENNYGIAPADLPESIEELARVEVETAGSTKSCPKSSGGN
jgi:hypothetical protein